mgnify:CR=1 FL=1
MLPEPYDLLPTSARQSQTIAAGDVLFRQGARTRGLYVLKTGRVHLERVGPNGERLIIHRATSGTSFAEASVFSERYHCDAIVMDAGKLVRIDKSAVLAAFATLFAVLTRPILGSLMTLAVFVVGHMSEDLWMLSQALPGAFTRGVIAVVYYLVPNLERFDFKNEVVHGLAIPPAAVSWACLYALVFVTVVLFLADLRFQGKDLK